MKKTKNLFLILFCILFSTFVNGQKLEYKKLFDEGDLLLLEENYMRALSQFKKAYQIDSLNANINFKIGFCYLKHPTEKYLAQQYFQKSIKHISKNYDEDDAAQKSAPIMAYLYLGLALHLDYKFEEAIKMFDTYISFINPKRFSEEIVDVEHYKTHSKNALVRVAAPANIRIVNMGDSVNSEYPDFSPILSADERMMIFTHAGKASTGAENGLKTTDDGFFEDIFVSYKKTDGSWTEAKSLHENINGTGHEGAVGITPDGQTLLVYRDDAGDGNLYYSNWDGKDWSSLIKFGPEINSQFWEPSACLNPNKDILYFVSDRPGGYGGRDIYRCKKLPNGNWSQPMNCGPKINSKWDEESPFVHPNGQDFFFSSQGLLSMGGFDIMFSVIDSLGEFGDVVAMPYPINTTDDDEFYFASADSKRAYYASSHQDRSSFGEQDIYQITLDKDTEENERTVLFKGNVSMANASAIPQGVAIVVINKLTGEQVGIYRPQRNGNFAAILKPGKTYVFSYQLNAKEFFIDEIIVPDNGVNYEEIEREVPLKNVVMGAINKGKIILLDVLVLNNQKEKRPVFAADVTIVDKLGNSQKVVTNDKGKISPFELHSDDYYKISAVSFGKFSATQQFSTSSESTILLKKILYLNKSTLTTALNSAKISLDVLVLSDKKLKAIAGAKIILKDDSGESTEYVCGANGKSEAIVLDAEKKYSIIANIGELLSNEIKFSTVGITKSKKIKKTLYIPIVSENKDMANNSSVVGGKFTHFFGYNKKSVEENPNYSTFLTTLQEMISKNEEVSISISSSASQVPTRIAGGNSSLSKIRGQNLKKMIVNYLTSKGISDSKIKFKLVHKVGGPTYNSDFIINRRTYEKYQFVKVELK